MSTDEVLASNLWPWPDPLLKRDRSGLVLFVNAAFLQLYGGQVQDWCGKPLAGWPAPVNVGAQRFETRIGAAPNENVYDWVESTMADGNALAIARNVTVFMTVPEPHVAETAPSMPEVPTRKHVEERPHQAQAQTAISVPPTPEPVQIQPAAPVAPPMSPAPELAAEVEDTLNKRADEYANLDNKAELATPQSAVTAPPVADQISQEIHTSVASLEPFAAPEKDTQENKRMMERRALPIEDSTNVLGSNWRDEVIAKAIGSTSTPEETTPKETTIADTSEEGTSPKPVAGLQILLAEDNAINALLTRTLLEAEGAEVDTVEDGALALEAVSKKKYDLIFMDMRMPNMDGLESTRKIRAFGFDRPIIALTANAFDDDRNACFDSGMNDFMTKPVSAEELSGMVRSWTEPEAERKLAS